MIYNKHNFEPGQVLKAQDLNEMEDGIVSATGALNLLDNSNFVKPINQRGVSDTISATGYFIDRWKLVSGSVTVGANGLTLNGKISQILENAPATVVTAVASAGTASFDTATNTFSLTASGELIEWAALYEGEYTVETLPTYVPKGYAAEMLECQRYFVAFRTAGTNGLVLANGYVANTTTARVAIPLSVPMRITPTVMSLNAHFRGQANSTSFDITNVSVLANARKQIVLQFNLTPSTTANTAIMFGYSSPDNKLGYHALSADL